MKIPGVVLAMTDPTPAPNKPFEEYKSPLVKFL